MSPFNLVTLIIVLAITKQRGMASSSDYLEYYCIIPDLKGIPLHLTFLSVRGTHCNPCQLSIFCQSDIDCKFLHLCKCCFTGRTEQAEHFLLISSYMSYNYDSLILVFKHLSFPMHIIQCIYRLFWC